MYEFDINDPVVAVYYAIGIAAIEIMNYSKYSLGITIDIRGDDEKTNVARAKYLWTALTLLGGSSIKNSTAFRYTKINFTITCDGFDEDAEKGLFTTFSMKSHYYKIFKPILNNTEIKQSTQENEKEFGHHVPDIFPSIRKKVVNLFQTNFIKSGYAYKTNKSKPNFADIGMVKLRQVFNVASLSPELKFSSCFNFIPRNKKIYQELLIELAASKKINTLVFSGTNLPNLTGQSIKTITSNIKHLIIENSDSSYKDLLYLIKHLDENITKITITADVMNCKIHQLDANKITKLLSALKPSIKNLCIENMRLFRFSGKELNNIFSALPKSLKVLDISNNRLGHLGLNVNKKESNKDELLLAFSSLKNHSLEKLYLRNTTFIEKLYLHNTTFINLSEYDDFKAIFAELPKSLKIIDFSNSISQKEKYNTFEECNSFIEFIESLPACPSNINMEKLLEEKKRLSIIHSEKLEKEKKQRSIRLRSRAKEFDTKIEEIAELIHEGVDIDYQPNPSDNTPLMLAIDCQNERVAEYLLNKGANPFIKNKMGDTARNLLQRESPLNNTIKGFELIYATMNNDLEAVKVLVNNDDNIINFQGQGGYTALLIAVEQGNIQITEFLLAHNPNVSATCDDGRGLEELATDENMRTFLFENPTSNNSKEEVIVPETPKTSGPNVNCNNNPDKKATSNIVNISSLFKETSDEKPDPTISKQPANTNQMQH